MDEVFRIANPFHWSKRVLKTIIIIFYAIFVPLLFYFSLHSAEASAKITSNLTISSIDLSVDVTPIALEDNQFVAPKQIVGSFTNGNKTFLIAHSSTAFKNLHNIKQNDIINYDKKFYKVTNITVAAKDDINMSDIIEDTDEKTLILMTCAGILFPNGDATHRLIVTAK